MIDPKKYGTASEAATAAGRPRTTLINAVNRSEIEHCYTSGGTLLISVKSAKTWAKQSRKTGPKPKAVNHEKT